MDPTNQVFLSECFLLPTFVGDGISGSCRAACSIEVTWWYLRESNFFIPWCWGSKTLLTVFHIHLIYIATHHEENRLVIYVFRP